MVTHYSEQRNEADYLSQQRSSYRALAHKVTHTISAILGVNRRHPIGAVSAYTPFLIVAPMRRLPLTPKMAHFACVQLCASDL